MKRKKSKQHTGSRQKTDEAFPKTGLNQVLPVALLVMVCFIVYYNSLSNGFVYDDFGAIVENKYLKQPGQFLSSLFNHSYFKIAGLEASYRPVSTFSYFLIYTIAGLDPFYYHLASLLLHTLNAVLVYRLANLILKNQVGALVAGLLFASHPALSEAVNCIDFNDDPLAAAFFPAIPFNIYKIQSRPGKIKSTWIFSGTDLLFIGAIVQGNGDHATGHYFSFRRRAAGW